MIVLILYHCYYWHATKTVGPRMMPCRLEDADKHNLRTLVQLPKLILLCKPDPATRSASISEYKTSEFCPIKYHSTEVVHFDQSYCPYEKMTEASCQIIGILVLYNCRQAPTQTPLPNSGDDVW